MIARRNFHGIQKTFMPHRHWWCSAPSRPFRLRARWHAIDHEGTHWQSFDAGVAAAHFCLAANALELGTLIMGRYDEEKIREILSLPEEV